MRLTLVISSLWGGGAERVLCSLANGWIELGHEVSILTFQDGNSQTYPLCASVKVCSLNLLHESRYLLEGLLRNVRRIWVLRRAIRESRPDMVISFMDQTNVITLAAACGLRVLVVISERIDPLHFQIGRSWRRLRRLFYPLADALVCPTKASLARFQMMVKVRGVAISNPVKVPPGLHRRENKRGDSGHVLIAMGRLVRQKGFDLLLEAFAQIAERHPDWSLTIIGKGPLRAELEKQKTALRLDERVYFTGEMADPFPVLCAADLFVFPSRFEGFGMALAEAMACGLPAVSFDCPEGPRDIIRNGTDGVLVPAGDVRALAAALDRLMSDSQERARMAARAPEVTARFSLERILSLWQQLFDGLLSGEGA